MWTISNWSLVEDLCTKLDADNLTRALANCTHQTVGFVGWATTETNNETRDKMSHIHGTDDYGHSGFLHSFQKPAHSDCDEDHDDERFKGRNDWLDACWLKWLNATHTAVAGWLCGWLALWLESCGWFYGWMKSPVGSIDSPVSVGGWMSESIRVVECSE